MALTPEQEQQLELTRAMALVNEEVAAARRAEEATREDARRADETAREQARHANNLETLQAQLDSQVTLARQQARLEAVRLARETLTENRRSLPVGEREITATDITGFADTLVNYINTNS